MFHARVVVVSAAVLLFALGGAEAQQATPGQDPAAGARVFDSAGCVKCHAINGVGGKVGPDLAKSARSRSFYDLASAVWNHVPRMTSRMEQMGIARVKLSSQQAGDVVAYL